MKKVLSTLAVGLLCVSSAFASGRGSCNLEATVKQVQALGILDGTVSADRSGRTDLDTYVYVATLDITSAVNTGGVGQCMVGEELIALKSATQVKVGDTLKIHASYMNDRSGLHSVTYTVK